MPIDGRIANQVRFIVDTSGRIIGYRNPITDVDEYSLNLTQSGGEFSLETADGVLAIANAGTPGTTLTATGTGYAAPCEFWGIEVSAYSGGPQTVVVRNGGSGGSIVATFTVSGVGFYSYSGPWNAPGNGQNLSRAMPTDVHLTITGGTSRSITPIVSPT